MENESFEGGKRRWYRYIECWDYRLDSPLGEGGCIQVEEDGAWELV
jgi:hypothetical protein